MKTRSVIITICCFAVLILGAFLLVRGDYGAMITPPVSGSLAEYKSRTPDDSIYIVEVYAKHEKGNCYYYFYTTP